MFKDLMCSKRMMGGHSYACGCFPEIWVNFMPHQAQLKEQRANLLDVRLLFIVSGAALERDAWWNSNCIYEAAQLIVFGNIQTECLKNTHDRLKWKKAAFECWKGKHTKKTAERRKQTCCRHTKVTWKRSYTEHDKCLNAFWRTRPCFQQGEVNYSRTYI